MLGTQADSPLTPADSSRAGLDFAHRLLTRPAADQPALPDLLGELAAVLAADGAGLASLPDGAALLRHPPNAPAGTWPWTEDPTLLTRLQHGGVITVERAAGNLLLAVLPAPEGTSWLLWLERSQQAGFSEAESATLALVAHALGRSLGQAGPQPRWGEQLDRAARQQRLEIAAAVTRRLAHDFGNVLTGILGFSELALAQQVPANTPLHSYLTEVYRGAQSGAQFTHQLRLFSRRQSATSRCCTLAPILAEEEARLRPSGLNLRLAVPADLPALALDPEQLRQVLTALLDNAREALVGPGSITVSAISQRITAADCLELFGAVQPGPHVEITIADTGIGLSPEVQRRLFAEPFFTTKPRRRGFGLATAYGILHAQRGGLRLYPGGEHGVVARVVVPAGPQPVMVPAGEASGAGIPALRGAAEKVLVVDDDPMILQLVATTLEQAGYRVQAVSSAEDALRCYSAQQGDPFRLVLSDVVMPQTSGVDLVQRLLKRDASVRVLLMSGHVSGDTTLRDLPNQAFDFLPKPFRPEGLLRAVRTALDRPEKRSAVSNQQSARTGRHPLKAES
jgi:signal transduction histidine kinase/FixJ family two-component response regulator